MPSGKATKACSEHAKEDAGTGHGRNVDRMRTRGPAVIGGGREHTYGHVPARKVQASGKVSKNGGERGKKQRRWKMSALDQEAMLSRGVLSRC